MECVSSIPHATRLAVAPNATQGYAVGGVMQNPWAINSSHAALFDCMSKWTFGKGTAGSHGHHFYLESPPISPRSGPTQSSIPIPHLTLGEGFDDSIINDSHLDNAGSLKGERLELNEEREFECAESLLSSLDVRNPRVLERGQSLSPSSPRDPSSQSFTAQLEGTNDLSSFAQQQQQELEVGSMLLQRYKSSDSGMKDSNDNAAPKSSAGAQGKAPPTAALQGLQVPSEPSTMLHEPKEEERHSYSPTCLMSPRSCRSSISITMGGGDLTEGQSKRLADDNDSDSQCGFDSVPSPADTSDDPAAGSDEHSDVLSPASLLLGRHRVKEDSRRWPWLSPRTIRNNGNIARHDRRSRVDKRQRRSSTKRHPRLHRSQSSDFAIPPNQSSDEDHADSALANWKEHESYSISGSLTSTEVRGPPLPRRLSAAIQDEQLPSEGGPSTDENVPSETSAGSFSSCDDMEADVSDLEQPHPLDSQRDQIVSLLLERYISYRTETQQRDAESSNNASGSGSNNTNGQPQSKTSRGKETAGQKRKRNSGPQDNDGMEEDDEMEPRRQKRSKRTEEESMEHQSFACPFSKKSPSKYRRCYRYDLKRIRDVKQHLRRCHRKAVYCPVCSETFQSEEARDTHVRRRSCLENPGFTVEGISEAQAQSLSGKCSTKLTAEEQWFQVFDICFPGHARPRSPYVDRHLSEELQSFRDYASVEGPSIIMEHLRAVHDWNEQDAAFLRQVLSDGIERIADHWSQGLASEGNLEASSQSPSARQRGTPKVAKPARNGSGDDAAASSLAKIQPQLPSFSSGDERQPNGAVSQTEGSIHGFGMELFDFGLLTNNARVPASGDFEYPPDLWALRYGPNVELTI